MSFTQDKITEKYINGSLRESNSVYYGEIVGKGSAICSFENTVNVRIFKGNNKLDSSKDGEVLKNVPFLVSSSTVAPEWEVGETVVVGFLNSDANSPYIIVKNSPFSTSVSGSNSSGDAEGNVDTNINGIEYEGAELEVPDQYGTVETYEKELINGSKSENHPTHHWAESSAQGQLRKEAIPAGRLKKGSIHELTNAAICDNRLMIATKMNIGGIFPVSVGDYLDVYFKDGSVWNCIVGDAKGADANSDWGHNGGKSVVEIIYWDYSDAKNFQKKVTKIQKVGNFYTGYNQKKDGVVVDGKTFWKIYNKAGVLTFVIYETDIKSIKCEKTYNGLMRPINGTDKGYESDEGLDVESKVGEPIYSPCDGTFVYSETGHTPWGRDKWGKKGDDTPYCIGINMDKPLTYNGKSYRYMFLAHLAKVVYDIPDGKGGQKVKTGELIGYCGTANDSPHLHIGLSGSKEEWSPLRMVDVRKVFGSSAGSTWVAGK